MVTKMTKVEEVLILKFFINYIINIANTAFYSYLNYTNKNFNDIILLVLVNFLYYIIF